MSEGKTIKDGYMNSQVKKFIADKKAGELMSATLTDIQDKAKMSDTTTDDILQSVDDLFEDYKGEYEKSLNIVEPGVTPIGSMVLTSAILLNAIEAAEELMSGEFDINRIEQFKKTVGQEQIVVAVGPDVRQLKVGDRVMVRMEDFIRVRNPNSVRSEEVFELPLEKIGDANYLEIHERNVKFIIH